LKVIGWLLSLVQNGMAAEFVETLTPGTQHLSRPPRRYAHVLFAVIQSALTSSIVSVIASVKLIQEGNFLEHWLRLSAVEWVVMLPVVIIAAPAILRLSELMKQPASAGS
jgi:hypothetical protein